MSRRMNKAEKASFFTALGDRLGSGFTPSSLPDEPRALPLSRRELEVLREAMTGAQTKQIAATLGCSPSTVKTHLATIFAKLRVDNRTAAAVYAVREHLT